MLSSPETEIEGAHSPWSTRWNLGPTTASSKYRSGTTPVASVTPLLPTWSCTHGSRVSLARKGNVHWRTAVPALDEPRLRKSAPASKSKVHGGTRSAVHAMVGLHGSVRSRASGGSAARATRPSGTAAKARVASAPASARVIDIPFGMRGLLSCFSLRYASGAFYTVGPSERDVLTTTIARRDIVTRMTACLDSWRPSTTGSCARPSARAWAR